MLLDIYARVEDNFKSTYSNEYMSYYKILQFRPLDGHQSAHQKLQKVLLSGTGSNPGIVKQRDIFLSFSLLCK